MTEKNKKINKELIISIIISFLIIAITIFIVIKTEDKGTVMLPGKDYYHEVDEDIL